MRRIIVIMTLLTCGIATAQTTISGRTIGAGASRAAGITGSGTMSPNWFVMTIIGNFLRHPNVTMRRQAITALVASMSGGGIGLGGTGISTGATTASGAYGSSTTSTYGTSTAGTTTGATGSNGSPVYYIPDLYALLNDPDAEVADLASIGLDVIFGTDMTILRFMNEKDPTIRLAATKIFLTKSLSTGAVTAGSGTVTLQSAGQLLALRTILVRLKYETDAEVRKSLQDALTSYVSTSTLFGRTQEILSYLASPNKEVRLKAISMAATERGDTIIRRLMDMYALEQDSDVKAALSSAIDTLTGSASVARTVIPGPVAPIF